MSNTKVITGKVRFSYCNIFTPRASVEGQEPKYSMSILIPKSDTTTVNAINAAIEAAKELGKGKWGGKVPAVLKSPLRDGDLEKPDAPEYEGHYFLNASAKQKPGVIDSKNHEITDPFAVTSGDYGRVSINFYPFNTNGNRGIAVGLNNIMKTEDGESLSGKSRATDDFAQFLKQDDFLD